MLFGGGEIKIADETVTVSQPLSLTLTKENASVYPITRVF